MFNQAYERRNDIELSMAVSATTRPDKDYVADAVSAVMSYDGDISNINEVVL
jgi:hypothetical protein